MTKLVIKRVASVILAMTFFVSIVGCDETDVAVGAGLIGVGIGLIIADDDDDHYKRDRRRDRHHRDHHRRDRRRRRDGRGGHHHGRHDFHKVSLQSTGVSDSVEVQYSEPVKNMAITFNMNNESAETLYEALEASYQGDTEALKSLGLTSKDMKLLAQLMMISDEGLVALSESLNFSVEDAEKMVAKLITEGKAQAQDEGSLLWQSCIQSGKWKTPENMSCMSTYWPGCGIDTGATMCIPKI